MSVYLTTKTTQIASAFSAQITKFGQFKDLRSKISEPRRFKARKNRAIAKIPHTKNSKNQRDSA